MNEEVTLESGDGCFSVAVGGGRVRGVRPRRDHGDVLYSGMVGQVGGGDRLWIAPEVEIFYEDPSDPDLWRSPPELDPGSWTLQTAPRGTQLTQRALGAQMTRLVTPVKDFDPGRDVAWCGYRVTDSVECKTSWSAWHLVMLPAPADLFVGESGDPVVYYPPPPALSEGWIRADGRPPRWKVGFDPPADSRCLLAALFDDDPGGLVVLTALLSPGHTYVDVPPKGGRAVPVQVFDSGGGGFCELELHAPLETKRLDSTVIAVWGSRSDRLRVLEEMRQTGGWPWRDSTGAP